jgi:hypothetical protein
LSGENGYLAHPEKNIVVVERKNLKLLMH